MTVPGSKPKLGFPGSPGVVSVGHDIHGGHGYKSAVIDDYPVKFGLMTRKIEKPIPVPRKRHYYGGGKNAS